MPRVSFFIFFVLLYISGLAQHRVSWLVTDQNAQPLAGALILTSTTSFITGEEGTASGNCANELMIFRVSHLGYKEYVDSIRITGSVTIKVQLQEAAEELQQVVIAADDARDHLVQNNGVKSYGAKAINSLPYLLGEQDPIKFVQTQPGVSTGTDGNNGYYVRGGGIDQNKIELDRIELYNSNHLFGFFSMFNAAAVDRIDYYKSGSPASVGGRLSSTMQVHTVDPDLYDFHGKFGVGVLSASLCIQIPLQKGKSSLLLAGRRSYFDLITQNLINPHSSLAKRTDYHFSDFLIKYHYRPVADHIISFTAFSASDDYDYRGSDVFHNLISWKSYNMGLRWKWLLSTRSDVEAYLNGGVYNQHFEADITGYAMKMWSDIDSWKGGMLVNQDFERHELTYGLEVTGRKIRPNQARVTTGDQAFTFAREADVPSLETGLFVDDNFQVNDKLQLALGIRMSGFAQVGPFQRYRSTENFVVLDTTVYEAGEWVKTYAGLEPRFRANYLIGGRQSLRFAYDRHYQYIHLSPLSSVSLPTDTWVPSSGLIRPQRAHQFTLGYHRQVKEVSFSVEAYAKWMDNQLEYRNGAIVGYSSGNNFDDAYIFGKGRSRGVEFFVQKDAGVFQYQVSYTWSKTERSLAAIQDGAYFSAKYDRRHDLNLVGSYRLASWTFSGLFKLATGSAITLPTAKYIINGNIISEYSERNGFRMPTYHRLDLAATYMPPKHPAAKWIISVYNVYNRSNPYYMYFDVQGDVNAYRLDINLKKVSLFPVLPSLSYELTF